MWAAPERHRRRHRAGFTLLELMVVLAIIASLTAAFPLALNRFVPARRADAAARELLADIRQAQARSMNTQAVVSVVPVAHGYELRDPGADAAFEHRAWRESTTLVLQSMDGDRRLAAVLVYPDGSSSGGRFLIRDGPRTRAVTVSELTGRVRLDASTSGDEGS